MNDIPAYKWAIEASGIQRNYGTLEVLKGVSISIEKGKMVAIIGKSGSGKSTLLHILGTLDAPDAGEVSICGIPVTGLKSKALASLRSKHLGFVFQFHHLLPEFTALENIAMPALITGMNKKAAFKRAAELLGYLQLSARADHKPNQLSGGEQQRVAIGRALMNEPDVILADEPSGNLDTETSIQVHQLLRSITTDMGKSLVIVTHNADLAALSDKVYEMKDGLLLSEK
ncbi:MAG: ABC transporter ATP-binding protein [Saprospiraceae bacterium]|nr:ABC transporter ATP-binding protein [Candidatus Opimibacter iunctus]